MASATRLKPDRRKADIVQAVFFLSENKHYTTVTRDSVAAKIGVQRPAVSYHYPTVDLLHKDVLQAAIECEILHVLAQAIVGRCPGEENIPSELRERALEPYL